MKITRKIFLMLLGFFLLFGVLSVGVLFRFVLPRFDAIETQSAHSAIQSCVDALNREVEGINIMLSTWRYWGDMLDFVQGRNPGFAADNLSMADLQSTANQWMVIFDARQDVVAEIVDDRLGPEGLQAIESAREPLREWIARLWKGATADSNVFGLFGTDGAPLLIAVGAITNSDGSAAPGGMIVLAQFLTHETIAKIGNRLNVPLHADFYPYADSAPSAPGDFQSRVVFPDRSRMTASARIKGLRGHAVARLSVTLPRRIRAGAIETIQTVSLIYLFGGVIAAIVFFMALDRMVLGRLTRLNREVNLISPSNRANASVTAEGDDEIAHTARTINDMVARLNRAHVLVTKNEAQFRMLTRLAPVGIFLTNADGECVLVNEQYEAITGLADGRALGSGWIKALHPEDRERVLSESGAAVRAGERYQAECRIIVPSGELRWVKINAQPIREEDGRVSYLGTLTDITNTKERQISLERKALYDELTGMANRILFHDRLQQAFDAGRRRPPHPFAVLFMDLDGFKEINDIHGHAAGDEVLREVARRINAILRPADTLSRLGGDEFAIILRDASEVRHCHAVADRVLGAVARPIAWDKTEVTVGISIGVALDHKGYESANDLVNAADKAMYRAKLGGKNRVVFENPPTAAAAAPTPSKKSNDTPPGGAAPTK